MDYIKELRELICHKPINIVASTVIVTDDEGRILLQKRSELFGT